MLDGHIPAWRGNINFNAHHAPMGAYFSFTCGHFGTRGGFDLPTGRTGCQDLFIGARHGPLDSDAPLSVLPFYDERAPSDSLEGTESSRAPSSRRLTVKPYRPEQIQRRYGWATDRWTTADMEFTVFSPFGGIVEPSETHPSMSRVCLMPAVLATLTVDNTHGEAAHCGVFAIKSGEELSGVHLLPDQHGWRGKERVGFGFGRNAGWQAMLDNDPQDRGGVMHPFQRWTVQDGVASIGSAPIHHLGDCAGVTFEVPAGLRRTLVIAMGAYLDGIVTSRLEGKFFYTRHFSSLGDVLDHALRGYDAIRAGSAELDRELLDSKLSPEQQFLIAHATRSYYANTQLLDVAGQPFWVVNDGELRTMNTLDAAADHVFWELKQNPWVVRNLLDNFTRHYSYHDQVKVPTDEQSDSGAENYELAAGGISFCHDMGVHNCFAPFGHSAYELAGESGIYSYMTQEQLCNWVLIAASYVAKTGDRRWLTRQRDTVYGCFRSMQNREGAQMPEMAMAEGDSTSGRASGEHRQSSGSLRFDSARCGAGGQEVTTYDTLDGSLGRARDSLYLGVKCIAAYLGLEFLFSRLEDGAAEEAAAHAAHAAADAVSAQMDGAAGFLPAVFDPQNPAREARVFPAVEALLFPWYWGTCEHGSEYKSSRSWLGNGNESFVAKLKRHVQTLLGDPERRNISPDEGLKLSSTSDQTRLSKLAIVQYVAREIFNLGEDQRVAETLRRSDAAHVKWQIDGAGRWACSDQFANGKVTGGRGNTRAITTTLWLDKVRT
jgi:hypothetical protein